MPEESNPPSKVNIVAIASDDDMWVVTTDQNTVLQILADPVNWIHANVTINGSGAVLWQPFVVCFQQISGAGTDPNVLVQGINETAVLTVQYVPTTTQSPSPLFPQGSTVSIVVVGESIYSHLELTGFTPTQVANTVFTSVTNPSLYYTQFNELPQTSNGAPVTPPYIFKPNATIPPQYLYQGWTPVTSGALKQGGGGDSCAMSTGNSDSQGNVWVNGIIVKSYSPTPVPSPSPSP